MALDPAAERAIKRAAGADAYARYLQAFTPTDVEDLWVQYTHAKLVGAAILESLADPADERVVKHEDRGSVDTKGRMAAYLEKAARLRADVLEEAARASGVPGPIVAAWGVDA